MDAVTYVLVAKVFAAAIATLALFGVALGMGNVVGKALQSIARNPSAAPEIQKFAILGIAFVEALGLFALLVVLLILFAINLPETAASVSATTAAAPAVEAAPQTAHAGK